MSTYNLELVLKGKEYWNKKISDDFAAAFPSDLQHYANSKRAFHHFSLPVTLSEKIYNICKQADARVHLCLLTGVTALLYKYNVGKHIVIGSPIYDQHTASELINTILLIRADFEEKITFKELLLHVSRDMKEAMEQQNFPLATLLQQKKMVNRQTGSTRFDVFVMQKGLHNRSYITSPNPGIIFMFYRSGDTISCEIEYDAVRYKSNTIEDLGHRLVYLLTYCLNHGEQCLNAFNLQTASALPGAKPSNNGISKDLGCSNGIPFITQFRKLAKENASATAIEYLHERIAYHELESSSDQFARFLVKKCGVQPGDRVAVKLSRSHWMVIALMGILKSRAAYVPVDLDYPVQRIQYIESDSHCKLIVDEQLIEEFKIIQQIYDDTPLPEPSGEDLAYIMYTSGSTGKPKGVAINNNNVVNYVEWANEYFFNNRKGFTFGFFTPLAFDLTVTCIFSTLLRGDKIYVYPEDEMTNIIRDVFSVGSPVNVIKVTPSHLSLARYMQLERTELSVIILGGEQLKKEHVGYLKQLNASIRIYNEYGPTETTVGCTCTEVTSATEDITIGRPIRNTSIYIVDQDGMELPAGIVGEIYVGGAGVATGYYNNASLTEQRFTLDIYGGSNKVIYRTGDLGRWLGDGSIEYIGRKDSQVKVNGFRIELAEIEQYMCAHPAVKEAIVLVKDTTEGDRELVSFYVTAEDLTGSLLRSFLQAGLPGYMIPHYFHHLEAFPLTPNGKIDTRALLVKSISSIKEIAYIAPRTNIEQQLAAIWQEVFGNDKIGVLDDFFTLGGHSLKATRLMTTYKKYFGINLTLQEIFLHPTIEQHANLIAEATRKQEMEIPVVEAAANYILSNAQKRLWLLSQHRDQTTAYNIPALYEISGDFSLVAFKQAITFLVNRHEIFRTGFLENEYGEPRQWIVPATDFIIPFEYYEPSGDQDRETYYLSYVQTAITRIFDLKKPPLFHLMVFKKDHDRHVLFLNMHHIISDGWSMEIMVREVFNNYALLLKGIRPEQKALRIQYKDYAAWHQQQLNEGLENGDRAYWLQKLSGDISMLAVPPDKLNPQISDEGETVQVVLPEVVVAALKQLTQKHHASTFITLLSVLKVLLYRYTGVEDIIVATPMAGRVHPDLDDQIGFYVNTLMLRTQLNGAHSFEKILERVKETALEAHAHQSYPLDLLLEELQKVNPALPVLRVNILVDMPAQAFDDKQTNAAIPFTVQSLSSGWKKVKADLNFSFTETEEATNVYIKYNREKYSRRFIQQIGNHLAGLAEQLALSQNIPIKEIDFLSEEDKETLLHDFGGAAIDFTERSIIEIFNDRVHQYKNHTAVVYEGQRFTYQQLDQLSNQFARYLQHDFAVKAADKIALILPRSEWLAVALFGIIKLGAVCVPIDPDYPEDRINYISKDSDCSLLLNGQVLSSFLHLSSAFSDKDLGIHIDAEQLLYIIYTSGSTGRPKGVGVTHANVVNIYNGWKRAYRLENFSVSLLQMASITFDVFFGDICRSLLMGGKMVICTTEQKSDPQELYRLMKQEAINIMEGTPALILPLMDYINEQQLEFGFMKVLILGSDTLNVTAYQNLVKNFGGHMRIINSYGTTETTIDALYFESDTATASAGASGNTPVGRPFPNIYSYILGNDLTLQPIGVEGELCIGGAGLSAGYINLAELTEQKFVPDPFKPGEKIYRTGDLCRWLPDGNIEFIGRKDYQIKFNGFRIEPGEIESVLCSHSQIRGALVMLYDDLAGGKWLVAYLVKATKDARPTASDLREYLMGHLPAYMQPSAYVLLDEFPLTINGKIDRKSLPAPEEAFLSSTCSQYVAPLTEEERVLVAVYEDVLRRSPIGMLDDFFMLGGDSIKSIQIVSRLRQRGYQLQVRDVLTNPCLQLQCPLLTKVSRALPQHPIEGPAIGPHDPADLTYNELSISELETINRKGDVEDVYELTPMQLGMYYHWLRDPAATAYFEQVIFRVQGEMQRASLEYAYSQIIARYPVLRTAFFDRHGGMPLQIVRRTMEPDFTFIDLSDHSDPDVALYATADLQRGFDLADGRLMRFTVLKINQNEYAFIWSHHHILLDGWCIGIIIKEFYQLYYSHILQLPARLEPVIPFSRYVRWLRSLDHANSLQYWKNYLQDYNSGAGVPSVVTNSPVDKEPAIKEQRQILDIKETGAIKSFCNKYRVTENSFLQTVWGILLGKYNNTKDVVYGVVVSGRPAELEGVEDMIGLFINTIPVRIQYQASTTAIELLQQVQLDNIHSLSHHHIQLAAIQAQTGLGGSLINHLFTCQNIPTHDLIAEGIQLADRQERFHLTQGDVFGQTNYDFDITLVLGQCIQVIVKYNSAMYTDAWIGQILQHIKNCITDILENPQKEIIYLKYLSEEEIARVEEEIRMNTAVLAEKTILDVFKQQVVLHPHRSCVSFEQCVFTYGELDVLSNQFAHYIQDRFQVQQGDRICIHLPRSEWLIIAIMAILKQGCAYVPVDPAYPLDRKEFILSDSDIKIIISEDVIQDFKVARNDFSTQAIPGHISADSLLYIIYTSGSTGRPKGVGVTHANAVNILEGWRRVYRLDEFTPGLLQLASVSFDVFFGDVCRSILSGGCMVICNEEEKLDVAALYRLMQRHAINMVEGTPMQIHPLMEYIDEMGLNIDFLKILILGSDTLPLNVYSYLMNRFGNGMRIINTYGTTETTIDTTYFEGNSNNYDWVKGNTPIGKPFLNNHVYILNEDGQLMAEGTAGEICIGGRGVTKGYWKRDQLTHQKFKPDPFIPGAMMYCTGDKGRRWADGTIEFIGRMDEQVKIRGYRIEPAEVEMVLREEPAIQDVLVITRNGRQGDPELVAFYVTAGPVDTNDLRDRLRKKVPAYMIPSHLIGLPEWPLTANGKVDRSRLAVPDNTGLILGTDRVTPRNDIQTRMAAIWRELLGLNQVGVNEDFFELGGHSIIIMRLISIIRKEFQLDIPIRTLFELSTIELLARYIQVHVEQQKAETESEDMDVIKL